MYKCVARVAFTAAYSVYPRYTLAGSSLTRYSKCKQKKPGYNLRLTATSAIQSQIQNHLTTPSASFSGFGCSLWMAAVSVRLRSSIGTSCQCPTFVSQTPCHQSLPQNHKMCPWIHALSIRRCRKYPRCGKHPEISKASSDANVPHTHKLPSPVNHPLMLNVSTDTNVSANTNDPPL